MNDERPILDYGRPNSAAGPSGLARLPWVLMATPATLAAALFIVLGVRDGIGGDGLDSLVGGCVAAVIAYVLWIPAGLRLWARRRPR